MGYAGGKEVSRSALKTTGEARHIRLSPEQDHLQADGASLAYVWAEIVDDSGNVVPDAAIRLHAEVSGAAGLLGFGSGNPITEENYTKGTFTSYQGRALAVLRSRFTKGIATLTVTADGFETAEITLPID